MKQSVTIIFLILTISLIAICNSTTFIEEIYEDSTTYDTSTIAMYIENEDGEYESTTTVPTSGYSLNTVNSYCTVDGSVDDSVTFGSLNNKVMIYITQKETKCYLYYDISTSITIDELIASKNVTTRNDFGIAFMEDTTGTIYEYVDGMYGGTSYYWAGAATDNYVYFANYYWRIIRINGDGSIRLIYDGTSAHENGDASDDRITATVAYNEEDSSSAYVGFTYTTGLQRPSEANSGTSSSIKTYLDYWYTQNLSTYASYIVQDGMFCNDREVANGYTWSTDGWDEEMAMTSSFMFTFYDRIYNSPSLSCSNSLDIYNTNIGLITADEVMLAGASTSSNTSYYLYTGSLYWTMTPYQLNGTPQAVVAYVNGNGYITTSAQSPTSTLQGVKPVINLASTVTLSGSGTAKDPYVPISY